MFPEPNYERDIEFRKLVTRQSDVDLTRAALEIARDAYPELTLAKPLIWLRERAAELQPGLAKRDDWENLEALAACLSDRHGLAGSPEA